MSIWNKILIGLVFIAAGGLLYMAARDLKTRQTWRTSAMKHADALKPVLDENEQIEQGSDKPDAPKSIVQLRRELHRVQLDRGRVWRKCDPRSVAAEGAVKLGIPAPEGADKPPPHGITAKAKVYLFEGTNVKEGGRFLGEFVATEIAEREIGLQPTRKLDAGDIQRLNEAQAKARQSGLGWTMHEEMPPDEHDVFAGLKDEDFRAMLPQSSVAEYGKDGKPAEANDPQDRREDGKYVRRLRDYNQFLERYSRERTELSDAKESGNRDKQGLEEALADSKTHEEFTKKEIARLKDEVAKAKAERDAVAEHLKRLDASLAQQSKANAQSIELNLAMAADIARRQLEAARLIDRRTGVMAQSGAGR